MSFPVGQSSDHYDLNSSPYRPGVLVHSPPQTDSRQRACSIIRLSMGEGKVTFKWLILQCAGCRGLKSWYCAFRVEAIFWMERCVMSEEWCCGIIQHVSPSVIQFFSFFLSLSSARFCAHTHTHRKLNKPARTQQQQQQQAGGWMCLLNVRRLSAADGMHSSKKHFQRRCRLYLRTQRVAKWKGCVDFFFLLFSPCFAGLNGRETIPTWIKWEAWWRWEGQSTPEMEEHLCVCVGCKKKKKKYEDESSRCIGLAIWLACGEMPTKT